ncbi:MAG: GIY-YIG nuclease family protein [Bryobacteraceae bacterium]
MLSKEQKKEAIHQFKERKPRVGVFAVRCVLSGKVWVGSSRNLDATRNGTWFGLRNGSHREPPLQQEWNAHGETAFQYEVLELLDEEVLPLAVSDLLAEKKKLWMKQLAAPGLL